MKIQIKTIQTINKGIMKCKTNENTTNNIIHIIYPNIIHLLTTTTTRKNSIINETNKLIQTCIIKTKTNNFFEKKFKTQIYPMLLQNTNQNTQIQETVRLAIKYNNNNKNNRKFAQQAYNFAIQNQNKQIIKIIKNKHIDNIYHLL